MPKQLQNAKSKKWGYTFLEVMAIITCIILVVLIASASLDRINHIFFIPKIEKERQAVTAATLAVNAGYQKYLNSGGQPSERMGDLIEALLTDGLMPNGLRGPFLDNMPPVNLMVGDTAYAIVGIRDSKGKIERIIYTTGQQTGESEVLEKTATGVFFYKGVVTAYRLPEDIDTSLVDNGDNKPLQQIELVEVLNRLNEVSTTMLDSIFNQDEQLLSEYQTGNLPSTVFPKGYLPVIVAQINEILRLNVADATRVFYYRTRLGEMLSLNLEPNAKYRNLDYTRASPVSTVRGNIRLPSEHTKRDLSGLQITGDQLNGFNGGELAYVKFGGINLDGFSPYGFNLDHADFSKSRNLTPEMLAIAKSINGTIITNTGITRNALGMAFKRIGKATTHDGVNALDNVVY